jgi:hypothetical protein
MWILSEDFYGKKLASSDVILNITRTVEMSEVMEVIIVKRESFVTMLSHDFARNLSPPQNTYSEPLKNKG